MCDVAPLQDFVAEQYMKAQRKQLIEALRQAQRERAAAATVIEEVETPDEAARQALQAGIVTIMLPQPQPTVAPAAVPLMHPSALNAPLAADSVPAASAAAVPGCRKRKPEPQTAAAPHLEQIKKLRPADPNDTADAMDVA